jgi:two-component system, cell cycle sensor histidine kinase and response regulator CckA
MALVVMAACALLFNLFYQEAKNNTIAQLHDEQMIHAKQAGQGIEDFFATWTRSLTALAQMDEIIATDAIGKHTMIHFYEAHQEQIRAIA